MNFSELETLMSSRGVTTLAEVARALNTTPQAVSNWKARNQVPHHVVAKLNQSFSPLAANPQLAHRSDSVDGSPISHLSSPSIYEEDTISLSDILLTLAEQLKVIVLVPFITVFLTFTYVQFIQQPIYESHSTILLPKSNAGLGGLAGIASQFGVNVPGGSSADLSSPSLFPELIKSRTFAERILDKPFYSKEFDKELSLLAIFTYGDGPPEFGLDTLIQNAIGVLQGMISFESQGSFSVLTVRAGDPYFAKDLNKVVLDELQSLNRYYKSQHLNEKTEFIKNRIESVENDLKESEQTFKIFREQNRQISSPALQLELEHLSRDVEIQKGIYLTLKQQQELAKIEEVEKATIVQVLDEPQVPLGSTNKNLKLSVLLAGILGIGLGIMIGFVRAYADNSDIDERKKLRRVKHFFKKKAKDIVLDRRVSGIMSVLLLIGLPFYLSHESNNPVFFGMYSAKLMLVNTVYVITLLFSIGLFVHLSRKEG
ncbi:MAG: hypothetical protein HN994_09400 [Candidatus Marinimicrobia bacterium]|jgi:uncharacterized protein involved in exopolysaccharide biosynthesis|nr:hypothetical protein [Candidatus Neomarinimicrobiota bacterium]MBT6940599.1 hypothetical protein [Candidatus Neomarinimicrobiota bacterium]